MNRRPWPLAALAVVALIGAGCSKAASDSDRVVGKAMEFAGCMRDHGVKQFPDPDASGRLTIDGVLNGSSIDSNAPAWKRAIAACRHLQPAGFTGTKVSAGQQAARLRFAQCIRENGVKDFPDPANGQPLIDTTRIPSANEPGGMTVLNAAMRRCHDASAAAGVTSP